MFSFKQFLVESRLDKKKFRNPSPDVLKGIAKRSKWKNARFVVSNDTPRGANEITAGDAYHHTHDDLQKKMRHVEGFLTHHGEGRYTYFTHSGKKDKQFRKYEDNHPYIKRLNNAGIRRRVNGGEFGDER